jgi:hypothetical protein
VGNDSNKGEARVNDKSTHQFASRPGPLGSVHVVKAEFTSSMTPTVDFQRYDSGRLVESMPLLRHA